MLNKKLQVEIKNMFFCDVEYVQMMMMIIIQSSSSSVSGAQHPIHYTNTLSTPSFCCRRKFDVFS